MHQIIVLRKAAVASTLALIRNSLHLTYLSSSLRLTLPNSCHDIAYGATPSRTLTFPTNLDNSAFTSYFLLMSTPSFTYKGCITCGHYHPHCLKYGTRAITVASLQRGPHLHFHYPYAAEGHSHGQCRVRDLLEYGAFSRVVVKLNAISHDVSGN